MGNKINNFITKYTWLFPLLILIASIFYYINWFERLFAEIENAYYLSIFKELEISIGLLLLLTSILNWALVGFWRHLYMGKYEPRWEIKNARRN